MASKVLILLGLFFLNGFLSMCEIALVSSRRSTLEFYKNKGNNGAKYALKLLSQPQKFLSTIQIGITLVGIVSGVYGGEVFTNQLQLLLANIEWLKLYSYEFTFTIIVITIKFFSIFRPHPLHPAI